MAHEVWRDVVGYEGTYQVSNLGRVRSLSRETVIVQKNRTFTTTIRGQIIKPHTDRYGYLYVSIGHKNRKVHRLVMEAFVGPSDMTVNHIDEDKSNNRLDNLEYMTASDNLRYGSGMKRRYLAAQRRAKAVYQIDRETGQILKRWPSLTAVESDGFSSQSVGKVCLGKAPHHRGYAWRYASDVEGLILKELGK